jgi:type VI secretion system protein ImpF
VARSASETLYYGSLLDRLTDPGVHAEDAPTLTRLRDGLRRDLENLLNSRRRFIGWPPEFTELEDSLLAYGLEDFTHETLSSASFRRDFTDRVALLLSRLEPRIQVHEVKVLDNTDALDRRLRFRITGVVRFGKERHSLDFDSFIDPVECDIVVKDR